MENEAQSRGAPVRFVFGLHLHQPVGNFDHVFANHVEDVYRPLIGQLAQRKVGPVLLHISGPLIEWLEQHDPALLDDVGRLVGDGEIEPLLGGMYEPILAAIPRADRVEQIAWHGESIRRLFGVHAAGLWLTERVWEPELPADLAAAGVEYVLVDDRHFLITGFQRDELHGPFRTESDGQAVDVLAIDERLRYLIPFHEPASTGDLLRSMHAAGAPLAVYADDGEKFGGWPGTKALVYERGWFDRFWDTLARLRDEGIIQMSTGRDAVRAVPPRGPVYLPTASYQEMETWALPPAAARRLTVLERDLGTERMAGPDRSFIRGAHWRTFLARYTESNRLQKKMVALSALSRKRGDPSEARRAVARAQCNDAYWHGVFGGLYLPHLRGALWRQLAIAECALRAGERLAAERIDIDQDGSDEIWVHGATFSAIVAPARGGAIVEWTEFATGVNHADTLTRRREAYHFPVLEQHRGDGEGLAPSIHDLETGFGLTEPPPADLDDRAIGVARILPGSLNADDYAASRFEPRESWARARCDATIDASDERIVVRCTAPGFAVSWTFGFDATIRGEWTWNAARAGDGDRFAPELTLAGTPRIEAPEAVAVWRYPVETYAKSERGLERVLQGESVTPLFDARSGVASVTLVAGVD